MPVRTEDDIIKDIIKLKNKQSILKIEENNLIDELVSLNKEDNNAKLDNLSINS
tara:strand:+ start:251 stop:412 length:162 start_codon:yes stop_codon:yes gene_type:complete